MNKITPTRSQNDVSRLLKQLRMDSFEFRTFDRAPAELEPESAAEPDLPAPQAAGPVSPVRPSAPSPPRTTLPATAQEGLEEAFGRLVRQEPLRRERKLSLRLNLPVHRCEPDTPSLPPEHLPIGDIFGRLMSLTPPRDADSRPEI
ncbi:MAG: hypothetical protein ACT4QA_07245 [Panacagrimonas sp.]